MWFLLATSFGYKLLLKIYLAWLIFARTQSFLQILAKFGLGQVDIAFSLEVKT